MRYWTSISMYLCIYARHIMYLEVSEWVYYIYRCEWKGVQMDEKLNSILIYANYLNYIKSALRETASCVCDRCWQTSVVETIVCVDGIRSDLYTLNVGRILWVVWCWAGWWLMAWIGRFVCTSCTSCTSTQVNRYIYMYLHGLEQSKSGASKQPGHRGQVLKKPLRHFRLGVSGEV